MPSTDPVERIWSAVYVGDSYEQRTLIIDTNGAATVTAHIPDGRTTSRVVRIVGKEIEVVVPATSEVLLATEHSLGALAATFAPAPEDGGAVDLYRPREICTKILGTVAEYLLERAADDVRLEAISCGDDHPCGRCLGGGWAYSTTCACVTLLDEHELKLSEPIDDCPSCVGTGEVSMVCDRCAGTGQRRSRATVECWGENGEVVEVELDANDFDVTQVTFQAPGWLEGEVREWTETCVDAHRVRGRLAELGFTAGDVVILETAGRAGRFSWRVQSGSSPAGVAAAFLRMLPRGAHPDLGAGPAPLTTAQIDRERLECDWDRHQRVKRRRVRVRPDRSAGEAVEELLGWCRELEEALGSGWRVQLWCNTGFIATGEHGPQITLCALSDDAEAGPIGIVGDISRELSQALETVVARIRHVDIDVLARRLLSR